MASKLLSNEFQKHICLDYECTTIEEAIHKAGDLLVQVGCVKPPYINGMIRREQETSTDIGLGVMIPHGTEDTLNFVLKPGISIVQIPHGVSYHGNTIHLVIGISSREEDSLQELMQITDILLKPEKCHQFLNASSGVGLMVNGGRLSDTGTMVGAPGGFWIYAPASSVNFVFPTSFSAADRVSGVRTYSRSRSYPAAAMASKAAS